MSRRISKPKVTVNPVANHYTALDERIIEVSFADGTGALIRLKEGTPDSIEKRPRIEVYRTEGQVCVIAPREEVARQAADDARIGG